MKRFNTITGIAETGLINRQLSLEEYLSQHSLVVSALVLP